VWFIALMNVAFGLIVTAIDVHAGMPAWWTLGEGPPIVAFGIAIAVLNAGMPTSPSVVTPSVPGKSALH
jgi:hypothetical protein